MKRHYLGAVYEMTQENFNGLIEQLDEAREKVKKLRELLDETNDSRNEAMNQLQKAESILNEMASWTLNTYDLYQLGIDGSTNEINTAREYFYNKLRKSCLNK